MKKRRISLVCIAALLCTLLPATAGMAAEEIIIDDNAPGYQAKGTGEWTASQYAGSYNGGHQYVFDDTETCAVYTPEIPEEGSYAISVYIPHVGPYNADMEAIINGKTERKVSYTQKSGEEGWYLLGAFELNKGKDNTVTLHATSKPHTARMDAVKFVKIDAAPGRVSMDQPSGTAAALDTQIILSFSNPMNLKTMTKEHFELRKKDGDALAFAVEAAEKQAVLTPAALLEPGTAYEVTISDQVTDEYGQLLTGTKVFTFETQTNDASAVSAKMESKDGLIFITYSKVMGENALNKEFYSIEKDGSFVPFTLAKEGQQFVLNPKVALEEGAEYTVRINPAVCDAFGNNATDNLNQTVKGTALPQSTVQPPVSQPGEEAKEVISGFHYADTGYTENGQWNQSAGVSGYEDKPTRYVGKATPPEANYATWQPQLTNSEYQVQIYQLKNMDNCAEAKLEINSADGIETRMIPMNQLTENAWVDLGTYSWVPGNSYVRIYKSEVDQNLRVDVMKFTPVDRSKEPVSVKISAEEQDGKLEIWPVFEVLFDRQMTTGEKDQITLKAGSETVPAAVSTQNGRKFFVQPKGQLQPGTTYTVTVPGTIKDAQGNGLQSAASQSFETTDQVVSPLYYDYLDEKGEQTGSLAAGGTAKAQLAVQNKSADPLRYLMVSGTYEGELIKTIVQTELVLEPGAAGTAVNELKVDSTDVFTYFIDNKEGSFTLPDESWKKVLSGKKAEYRDTVWIEIPEGQTIGFVDLDTVPWAEESILGLMKLGIVSGTGEGRFSPDDYLTKEQFVKMLVGAFGIGTASDTSDFADVEKEQWYYEFISRAANAGIVKGSSDNTFGVGGNLSREDMATLLFRAAEYAGIQLKAVNPEIDFIDAVEINAYAAESISVLQKAGIINGVSEDEFAPQETTTRAMAAKVIYGVMMQGGMVE